MNNYDDIKRFIDKSKTEGLDYKEINEKSMGNGITSSMNKWTLIKQISSGDEPQGALDNGRTTQPTPQPVNQEEFKNVAPAAHKTEISSPTPARAAEAKNVSNDIVSSSITPVDMNILDTLRAALPDAEVAPQPAPAPQAVSPFATRQPAPAAVQPKETSNPFRQMFKHKAPQPEGNTLPRDTPLQPLLEMIASCR
ncbi:MAG: cellulose biosynthesis protein BcsO [Ewingella americana]|jgi:pyruvate/2-oxoglutarate dehydrogenase complex dihydrolipoamide acyltransferase (E2) component|uniref:cellulose biosynthesis protein BcsO n=1 Tax=Ewingella americana TaxID=41202 RepID=UPI00242CE4E2|nr:cellulose biosynthesis protein BcsO [Ewingella americana]MCI1679852.1 cellulose biosynthesis protein BcsO [Ewingella americana]MCI1855536.1 cellulose biosynthesis protein BcsO [Ewingella americana]MCI1862970.1 cellulose biosynthesis protein BcsO [Ewingella americana]MCI2140644.1 cellulose biosynthesis protein BcsO [Ewingella americana]MCI2165794.1 cellulose biosynthesis protein BcsO [Ewingella americana]